MNTNEYLAFCLCSYLDDSLRHTGIDCRSVFDDRNIGDADARIRFDVNPTIDVLLIPTTKMIYIYIYVYICRYYNYIKG